MKRTAFVLAFVLSALLSGCTPWQRAASVVAPVAGVAAYTALSGQWGEAVERRADRLERVIWGRGMGHGWSWAQHTMWAVGGSTAAGVTSWSFEGYVLASVGFALGYHVREIENVWNGAKWWDSTLDVVGPLTNAMLAIWWHQRKRD